MKTAVVYYSLSGHTEEAAQTIARDLQTDLIRLSPVTPYPAKGLAKYFHGGRSALKGDAPALTPYAFSGDYDLVIFGTPVWASNFVPPLRTFIRDNREALKGKKLAAYICLMGGGGEKALARLREALGVEKLAAEMSLVDAKGKNAGGQEELIRQFCAACRNSQ
ncbi:MAG: flavodoxin [Clostridia bacterium]|nr:flavodoxin [Clostridia bacterium]